MRGACAGGVSKRGAHHCILEQLFWGFLSHRRGLGLPFVFRLSHISERRLVNHTPKPPFPITIPPPASAHANHTAAGGASATTLVVVVPDHEVIEPAEGLGGGTRSTASSALKAPPPGRCVAAGRSWDHDDALQHTRGAALRGALRSRRTCRSGGSAGAAGTRLPRSARHDAGPLQALVDRLDASIGVGGPSPLLALLTDCDDVHAAVRAAAPGC